MNSLEAIATAAKKFNDPSQVILWHNNTNPAELDPVYRLNFRSKLTEVEARKHWELATQPETVIVDGTRLYDELVTGVAQGKADPKSD